MNDSLEKESGQILLFTLDELVFALPLLRVIKVIHSIEIRELPKAPDIISGIINVRGQIIPVVDIRKLYGLMEHEINLDDRFIIADTGKREVAIIVDSVTGIRELLSGEIYEASEVLSFAELIRGVVKTPDGLILIYNLEKFLNLDEEKELEQAMKTKRG